MKKVTPKTSTLLVEQELAGLELIIIGFIVILIGCAYLNMKNDLKQQMYIHKLETDIQNIHRRVKTSEQFCEEPELKTKITTTGVVR